jgi:hypothetical protein
MSEPDHNPFAAPLSQNLAETPARYVDFEGLRTTGNGLRLIYFSLLLLVLLVLAVFGGAFFTARAPGPNPSGLAFILVTGIGMLLIALMSLIGGVMCITVPQESGGKWLVTASVVIQGLNLLVMLTAALFFGFGRGNIIVSVVNGISLILFLLFLRRVSSFIDRDDLRRRSARVLIFLFVYVIAVISTAMIPIQGALNSAVAYGLIGGVGALILFLMFANLVNDMSKAIRHPESSIESSRGHI